MNIDFKKKPKIRTQTVLVRRITTSNKHSLQATSPPRPKPSTPPVRMPTGRDPLDVAPSSCVPAVPAAKPSLTKRKASTPVTPLSSDSEGNDGEPSPCKRARTIRSLGPDLRRRIHAAPQRPSDGKEGPVTLHILHAYDLVKTDHWKDGSVAGSYAAKDFEPAFEGFDEVPVVEVQYPSNAQPERFALVCPREGDGYMPLEDIVQTVETICKHYFPDDADALIDEGTGFPRRLKRAIQRQEFSTFEDVLIGFNKMISNAVAAGRICKTLEGMQSMPLSLTEYILSQTYSRTVSPRVSSLRRYESGSSNVYGELLPRFVHRIFQETGLRSDHTFVDLGSGVGNIVLQAALEVGCESWGVESMPNPSSCAELQKSELLQRARLWGISLGDINLIADDFLENQEIGRVLKRADVIVVNNKAFSAQLNANLKNRFLDLKEGARIVSLVSFVSPNHEIKCRKLNDPVNFFSCVEKEYHSGSVSWTHKGGKYYIQIKDRSRLDRFLERSHRGK